MGRIRRQDIGILFFYFLGYSKIRYFFYRLFNRPITIFLAFHDIFPEFIHDFKDKMIFLKQKTNVINIEDFFNANLSMKKINVVITFDDGFKSWVSTTLPILADLNLSATFFISSGSINLTQEDEIDFTNKNLDKTYGTGCLTFDDIKKIATENITIGGHTLNHAHLSRLNDKEQILHEIIEDKKQLEEISNKKIDYFSYPFGEYHNRYFNLQEILKDAGYKGAVTLMPGINNQKTNPFLLFRMITGAKLDLNVFKAITYENSSAVYFLKKLFSMNRDRGRPHGRRPPSTHRSDSAPCLRRETKRADSI